MLGKTLIIAFFALWKCILFPYTKFITASCTFKQGRQIINKISDEILPRCPLLRNEIESISNGQNDCQIHFKNGQYLRVLVANENARSERSTVICIDEKRQVKRNIVDTVFKPMNSSPRYTGYSNKPEYAHLPKEVPQEFYLSSAWYVKSELFEQVTAYFKNMFKKNLKYFVIDLPYQLSIKQGILLPQTIINEMQESTFQEISFGMEREGIFWGSAEDSLFDYDVISKRRILKDPLYPLAYYLETGTKIPDKKPKEIRIASVDIALMGSKKHNNDSQCITIHSGVPTSMNNYMDNIIHIESYEGILAEELGLIIMRCFYQYKCDYLVIDASGRIMPL